LRTILFKTFNISFAKIAEIFARSGEPLEIIRQHCCIHSVSAFEYNIIQLIFDIDLLTGSSGVHLHAPVPHMQ